MNIKNYGEVIDSPGGSFRYRVFGAVCQLFDKNSLPYPCCRLSWKSKEPFWNRQGKRFVPDIAVKRSPSYCVQLVGYPDSEPFVITLYWVKLSTEQQNWWYARRVHCCGGAEGSQSKAPLPYRMVA